MGICSSCLGFDRRRSQEDVSAAPSLSPPQPHLPLFSSSARDVAWLTSLLRIPLAQDAETRGLLSDDPYRGPHYGTDGAIPPHQRAQYQEDPESVRHRREALEGICYTMSE